MNGVFVSVNKPTFVHLCLFTMIKKFKRKKHMDAVNYYLLDRWSVNSRKCCKSPGLWYVTHNTGTDPVHERVVCNLPKVGQKNYFNNVFFQLVRNGSYFNKLTTCGCLEALATASPLSLKYLIIQNISHLFVRHTHKNGIILMEMLL